MFIRLFAVYHKANGRLRHHICGTHNYVFIPFIWEIPSSYSCLSFVISAWAWEGLDDATDTPHLSE